MFDVVIIIVRFVFSFGDNVTSGSQYQIKYDQIN